LKTDQNTNISPMQHFFTLRHNASDAFAVGLIRKETWQKWLIRLWENSACYRRYTRNRYISSYARIGGIRWVQTLRRRVVHDGAENGAKNRGHTARCTWIQFL